MAQDRFAAEGYKILQSVEIDGMEIVIAENREAEKPYLTWRRSVNEAFGAETHLLPVYSGDYVDILRAFVQSQSACVDNLSLDRIYRGSIVVDAPLSIGDCVPDGMASDLKGQVVVLRPDILLPEYRAASHQIFLAQGGFGCSPEARGRSIFGTNLYSGEQERWNRGDILGVVAETTLPGWAFEKLERLRELREKESVLAKLQAAKNNSASPKTEEARQKKPREPEI